MAIRSGLFDSTEVTHTAWGVPVGNKAQSADFFAEIVSSLVGDGLLPLGDGNDPFKVRPNGRHLKVDGGKAFLRGYFCYDKSENDLTLETDGAAHTYEVVLRLDLVTGEIGLKVLTDPGEVTLPVRNGDLYDLWLATVTVPAWSVSVTAAMIEDHRADESVCGFCRALKHSPAERLERACAITLAGAASGTGYFDGAEDMTLTVESLDLGDASGVLPVSRGGTGGVNATSARINLGAAPVSHVHTAAQISGGRFDGTVRAEPDGGGSSYEDFHVRDISLRTVQGSQVENGAVIMIYA